MRNTFVVALTCSVVVGYGCDRGTGPIPTLPSPTPSVASPPPPPTFPSVAVGEVVRFQVTNNDTDCVGGGGRCRSYNVTAPSDGRLRVEATSVSGDPGFLSTLEMYVVPGGDSWDTGPGPRISVTIQATAGRTYEIRMYSASVPSVDLELLASLSPA